MSNNVLLAWVVEQSQGSVANEVDGGFVACDVEQYQERHQFFGGHLFAGFFCGDERGQHVVAKMLASILDDGGEIGNEFFHGFVGSKQLFIGCCRL